MKPINHIFCSGAKEEGASHADFQLVLLIALRLKLHLASKNRQEVGVNGNHLVIVHQVVYLERREDCDLEVRGLRCQLEYAVVLGM